MMSYRRFICNSRCWICSLYASICSLYSCSFASSASSRVSSIRAWKVPTCTQPTLVICCWATSILSSICSLTSASDPCEAGGFPFEILRVSKGGASSESLIVTQELLSCWRPKTPFDNRDQWLGFNDSFRNIRIRSALSSLGFSSPRKTLPRRP